MEAEQSPYEMKIWDLLQTAEAEEGSEQNFHSEPLGRINSATIWSFGVS